MSERRDVRGFTASLSGWDELAIQRMFGMDLTKLEGTMQPRALQFVANRRDGMKDRDAHQAAMDITLGDLESLWQNTSEDEEPEDDPGKDSTASGPTPS